MIIISNVFYVINIEYLVRLGLVRIFKVWSTDIKFIYSRLFTILIKDYKFPNFENVNEIIKYWRIIDRFFDFLNSKSMFSKKFKTTIFKNNIDQIE